tara:strand:- start:680 stop:1303 length:624 start_codon:yes stop_codon:yes gene_type:complete
MAQISSYPLLSPQLGDKVLGSNLYDSSGNVVTGNPTCQFNFTDVKTLIDQNFVQQLYSFSTLIITPPNDNTGASIKFGATNAGTSTDNVYYTASTNTFTFRALGTYYIQLTYNTRGNGGTSPKFVFITKDSDGNQVGPTTINKTTRGVTADRVPVNIDIMLNITGVNSNYQFWAAQEDVASGALVVDAFATGWADVPSAEITISKLI